MSNNIVLETQKQREEKILPIKSESKSVSNIEFVKEKKPQIELVSDSDDSSNVSEMEIPQQPRSKKSMLPPAFANTLMNPLKAMPNTGQEVTDQYYSDSDSYQSSSEDEVSEHPGSAFQPPSFSTSQSAPPSQDQDKQEIFLKLMALKNKGVVLSKNFTPNSDYTELKLEYDRQSKMLRNEAGVKFARRMLMGCVTGMEFMNKRFDPVGAKLDGWSENVMENIGEYDDVFEKLYEKYSSDTEMAPEFQLLFTLGGSAFMFHLTNTMFKSSLPNVTQPTYIPPSAPAPAPAPQPFSSSTNKENPSNLFKQPPDMPGPSANILSELPNISDALKKGPSVPVISRPETFSGSPGHYMTTDDDRFSDGTDSKMSDLSEVRSVSINMGSSSGGGSSGKNKITIGR